MKIVRCLIFAVALGLPACSEKQSDPAESLFDSREPKALARTIGVQVDNAAAADATLYAVHFDGVAINALGRAKIHAMLRSRAKTEIIYVDSPAGLASARQGSVGEYLRSLGLAAEHVGVQAGADPRSLHPVAGDLERMSKTESGASANQPTKKAVDEPAASPLAPPSK